MRVLFLKVLMPPVISVCIRCGWLKCASGSHRRICRNDDVVRRVAGSGEVSGDEVRAYAALIYQIFLWVLFVIVSNSKAI